MSTEDNLKRKRTAEGPEESEVLSEKQKKELVERYVKAFPPEQLTNIQIDIVAQVPDAFNMLESYASNEVSHRKIFLRGIGPDTNQQLIKDFFSRFGIIEKAEIVQDKITGKNKGFAFLLFQDISSVNGALASEFYEIDGKHVYVNLAVLGKQYIEEKSQNQAQVNYNNQGNNNVDEDKRKLFIRGLNPNTTVETLRAFFSMHGEIESCNVVMDKVTKKSKNYGFVIYKNSSSTGRALKNSNPVIDGRSAVVVLASEGVSKPLDPYQQQLMMAGYPFAGQQMVPQQLAPGPQGYMYAPSGIAPQQMVYPGAGQPFPHQGLPPNAQMIGHTAPPQAQLRSGNHYQSANQKW